MKRRITWDEYDSLRFAQSVWVNGLLTSACRAAIPNPFIFNMLTVEADMPDPEPSHPPIPDGWELCTKETYRNGEWKYSYDELKDWDKSPNPHPLWSRDTWYIQPIKPEPRRFGSWGEISQYMLNGGTRAIFQNETPVILHPNPNRHYPVVYALGVDLFWEQLEANFGPSDLAYPEGYNG